MTAVLLDREDIPAPQLADALRTQTPDGQYRSLGFIIYDVHSILLTGYAAIWRVPLRQGLGLGKFMPVLHLQLLLKTLPDRCVKPTTVVGKRKSQKT